MSRASYVFVCTCTVSRLVCALSFLGFYVRLLHCVEFPRTHPPPRPPRPHEEGHCVLSIATSAGFHQPGSRSTPLLSRRRPRVQEPFQMEDPTAHFPLPWPLDRPRHPRSRKPPRRPTAISGCSRHALTKYTVSFNKKKSISCFRVELRCDSKVLEGPRRLLAHPRIVRRE